MWDSVSYLAIRAVSTCIAAFGSAICLLILIKSTYFQGTSAIHEIVKKGANLSRPNHLIDNQFYIVGQQGVPPSRVQRG